MEAWEKEAQQFSRELAEFGHPIPTDGETHAVREYLVEAFEAAAKRHDEFRKDVSMAIGKIERALDRLEGTSRVEPEEHVTHSHGGVVIE